MEQWNKLLRQCLIRRLNGDQFRELAQLLLERDPVPQEKLIEAVLESKAVTNVYWDPLVPQYLETLRQLGAVKIPEILSSLLNRSSIKKQSNELKATLTKQPTKGNTLLTDFGIIQDILVAVTSGWVPKSAREARQTLISAADWVFALLSWDSANADDENPVGCFGGSHDVVQLFEAVGILLAGLIGGGNAIDALFTANAEGTEPNSCTYPEHDRIKCLNSWKMLILP
jgi:mediator of RNA polymerase II transcription subunit 5